MNDMEKMSRIIELEQMLTTKIIDNRAAGYQPSTDDEDALARKELSSLREELRLKL